MPERKVKHITDDQALGHILRRKRPFAGQIIPVLHLPHAARIAILKPTGLGVGIAQQFGVRVSHQHGATALESASYRGLERIIGATAAPILSQTHVVVLRVRAIKLSKIDCVAGQRGIGGHEGIVTTGRRK